MRTLQRLVACGLVAAAACTAFLPAPAAAAPAAETFVPVQCLLQPGVYGITDSKGAVVGLLIIYPDCRMEVFRRPPAEV